MAKKTSKKWAPKDDGTWYKKLREKVLSDPEGRAEYEAFGLQLNIAKKIREARKKAHLTQETIAQRMETTKSVVTRLEAAGGKGKHAPSLATLAKFAHAIGCHLDIRFVRNTSS